MSETRMIEVVARALAGEEWAAKTFNETLNGDNPDDMRAYWLDKARAAIEAMRITDDVDALSDSESRILRRMRDIYVSSISFETVPHLMRAMWSAAIDTALEEI